MSQQALVRGRVQGVGFRAYTRQCARTLSIMGHVCNLPDGSVFILACASAAKLVEFWNLIRQGPPLSHVEQLVITNTNFIPEHHPFDIIF